MNNAVHIRFKTRDDRARAAALIRRGLEGRDTEATFYPSCALLPGRVQQSRHPDGLFPRIGGLFALKDDEHPGYLAVICTDVEGLRPHLLHVLDGIECEVGLERPWGINNPP